MIPSMDAMLNDFRRLKDQKLLTTLHDEVKRERDITLRVLLLLIVVEQRRLHIDRYSSLFAYCTDQLKYSSSAAGRRIAGARCLRDYPRAWPMLFDGRLNLTTLCIIARVITPENAEELLNGAAGRTQRQVEDLVAQYGGSKPVRDRIKPVRSLGRSPRPASQFAQDSGDSKASGRAASQARSEGNGGFRAGSEAGPHTEMGCKAGRGSEAGGSGSEAGGSGSEANSTATESRAWSGPEVGVSSDAAAGSGPGAPDCGDGFSGSSAGRSFDQSQCGDDSTTAASCSQPADEPLTYEITFRADAAFVEKLRRLQTLLSTDSNPSLAPIFDRAIELALDRYDPERRQARRERRRLRKSSRTSKAGGPQDAKKVAFDSETDSESSSKPIGEKDNEKKSGRTGESPRAGAKTRSRIPQWLRDKVLTRDGHRCTHIGPSGRCPAVSKLEIDHIWPHAQGGSDHTDNLRTLCRAHNQRAAEIMFGVEYMRRRRGIRSPLERHFSIQHTEHNVERAELGEKAGMESVPV